CRHFNTKADWGLFVAGGWFTLGRRQIIRLSRPLQSHNIDDYELLVRLQVANEASQVLILTFNRHADSYARINSLPLRICGSRSGLTIFRGGRLEGCIRRTGGVPQSILANQNV